MGQKLKETSGIVAPHALVGRKIWLIAYLYVETVFAVTIFAHQSIVQEHSNRV